MTPALTGSPPTENGEGGTCLQQARPQIKNNAPKLSVITRAAVKTFIVAAAVRGTLPATLATWLINAGGLRNA